MKKPTLEEYINTEISSTPPKWWDKDGNSSRAILTRGEWGEFLWQCRKLFPTFISDCKYNWAGWETPINYFISVPLWLMFFWSFPLLRTIYSWNRAKKEYQREWEKL